MDKQYSYAIELEKHSGEREVLRFDEKSDAEDAFIDYAYENDSDLRNIYSSATLYEIDWYGRADRELKSVSYEKQ